MIILISKFRFVIVIYAIGLLVASCTGEKQPSSLLQQNCIVSLMVLGVAQDGGKPQIGNPDDPAWQDKSLRRLATSIALIDGTGEGTKRYLFDTTPDLKEQLQYLDEVFPASSKIGIDGIFLTHAHIGHYTGLMLLGHESAGAKGVPVYAMPRMASYLAENGPWSQLVAYENIVLQSLAGNRPVDLGAVKVTPLVVPHRQEFSEVVGYRIEGPSRSALFIPDIDSWEEWDEMGVRIEREVELVDFAFLDATFYANGEIPGRDMSGFPHPFIIRSMERFKDLPETEKAKIRFIHLNHTNPALLFGSEAQQTIRSNGFGLAEEKELHCL